MRFPLTDGLKTANNQNRGCFYRTAASIWALLLWLLPPDYCPSPSLSSPLGWKEKRKQLRKGKKVTTRKKETRRTKHIWETHKVIKIYKEEKRPPTSWPVFSFSPPPACPSRLCQTILDHTSRPDSPEVAVTHRASLKCMQIKCYELRGSSGVIPGTSIVHFIVFYMM